MPTTKQIAARFNKHIDKKVEGDYAELGRHESTGSYTVPVSGGVNEVYARLNGDDDQLVTAIDMITSRKPRLPVLLRKNISGRYVVVGVEPIRGTIFLNEAAPSNNLPPILGNTMNAIWENYQFKPGRVRALNGSDLQVYMEELPYVGSLLGNVNGDATTEVGTITSGKKAWVGVSVDPVTNTLAFTKGTEYGLPVPLTRAGAFAIVDPVGNIPLWAYAIRAGATYIPVQPQSPDTLYFVDRRPWLIAPDPTATVTTTDATQTTLASIAVAEASLLTITGTFSGVKSDYSAAISGTFVAGIRRATAGNATLIGVTVTSNEDSGGTPAFTVDADTGTQTARLRIQGISAETWNWSVKYSSLVS